jgi:hypothetical protein
MATICTLIWPELRTDTYTGKGGKGGCGAGGYAFIDAEIDVDDHAELGGLVASLVGANGFKLTHADGSTTSQLLGALGRADARIWRENPGLRQALLDRVRCMTLVRG